jgi:hypothetical protein
MRDPYSLLSSYLKGSIQALDPQLVHVGVGNVIDQLHLDSVITSERSSKRVPLLVINRAQDHFIHILLMCHAFYGLLFFISELQSKVDSECVNEGGNETNIK